MSVSFWARRVTATPLPRYFTAHGSGTVNSAAFECRHAGRRAFSATKPRRTTTSGANGEGPRTASAWMNPGAGVVIATVAGGLGWGLSKFGTEDFPRVLMLDGKPAKPRYANMREMQHVSEHSPHPERFFLWAPPHPPRVLIGNLGAG